MLPAMPASTNTETYRAMLHPKAIYILEGQQYFVETFDYDAAGRTWLLNLAARALQDCLAGSEPEPVLLWLVPEAHREHPSSAGVADAEAT